MNEELRQRAGLELVKELTFQEDKNNTWVLTENVFKFSGRKFWELKLISWGRKVPEARKTWQRLPKDIREMFNA